MNKKYKVLALILILVYPCYKAIRELIWVKHFKYNVDNSFQINLRIDTDLSGFQDINVEKTITLINLVTKKRAEINYVTIEPDLYFFVDSTSSIKTISIVDKFAGQNLYNYQTLQLMNSVDCFKEFGGCGGFSNSGLTQLGKPFFVYDGNSIHK